MSGNIPAQWASLPDWQRLVAGAVNPLLNRLSYLSLFIDGAPAAGQQILRTKISQPMTLVAAQCVGDAGVAATASAVFTIKTATVTVGTITFGAGQTSGVVSITDAVVPALALFEVYAPAVADATLADVALSLAVAR